LAGVALKVYPVEPAVIFGAANGVFKSSPYAEIIENDETLNAMVAITASALRNISFDSLTVKRPARLLRASPVTIST
jgi:hypothetical protein